MKKVYSVYHWIAHEGVYDVVGVYTSHSKAKEEAMRLEKAFYSKRLDEWNAMSKNNKLICGPKSDYVMGEGWRVEEHDLIEGE